jgi:hypothetical protein
MQSASQAGGFPALAPNVLFLNHQLLCEIMFFFRGFPVCHFRNPGSLVLASFIGLYDLD